MSYSWSSIDKNISAADRQEVKTNSDAFVTKQGMSGYTWTYTALAGKKIDDLHWTEMKNAIDYLHTNNVCATYNASYDIGYDATLNTQVDATQKNGVDASYNTSVNTGQRGNLSEC